MFVIPSKTVREVFEFRIKSLGAAGMHELASILHLDFKEIIQHEIHADIEPKQNIFLDRVRNRDNEK